MSKALSYAMSKALGYAMSKALGSRYEQGSWLSLCARLSALAKSKALGYAMRNALGYAMSLRGIQLHACEGSRMTEKSLERGEHVPHELSMVTSPNWTWTRVSGLLFSPAANKIILSYAVHTK